MPQVPSSASSVLDEMVRRIRAAYPVESIVLFGSRAVGSPRPDSDYDLLVVLADDGDARRAMADIQASLAGLGVAKDLVVVPASRYRRYRAVVNTVYWHASTNGKTLYERAA